MSEFWMDESHMGRAAFRNMRTQQDGFHFFRVQAVEGGLIMTGSRVTGVKERGPNKGQPKWVKPNLDVIVSDSDLANEKARFEREEHRCHQCEGSGQTLKSAGINGRTYRECSRCKGSGNPPLEAA